MRWVVDGVTWSSKFEYQIFAALNATPHTVAHKTTDRDAMNYTAPVTNGLCEKCGNRHVVTERHYTPDLLVYAYDKPDRGFYVEAKGYLRAERRSLLRAWRKSHPTVDLRMLVQRDYKVTAKLTITQWAAKFLKIPVAVWTGTLPEGWV
jgi:hypothetical protein